MADPTRLAIVVDLASREGSSAARGFLQVRNFRVRGLTRDMKSARRRYWISRGVEVAAVDFNDEDSVSKAFSGAAIIFVSTDFWAHLADHSTKTLAYLTGHSLVEIASNCDLRQAQIFIIAAAGIRGLQRFILSTLPSVNARSHHSIRGAYHFDCKAETVKYLHDKFPILAAKTSFLYSACPMDDYKKFIQPNGDGTFTIGTTLPGDVKLPWVHPENDIGAHVAVLGYLPIGTKLTVGAEQLSWDEICTLFTQVCGITITYRQYTVDEVERLVPHCGQLLADSWLYIQRYGYHGGDNTIIDHHEVRRRTNICIVPTSFEMYLREDLPGFLQNALAPFPGSAIVVFHVMARPGSPVAVATSQAVAAQQFRVPTRPVGHMRRDFIGNHLYI